VQDRPAKDATHAQADGIEAAASTIAAAAAAAAVLSHIKRVRGRLADAQDVC
jgi:hypothetical protein